MKQMNGNDKYLIIHDLVEGRINKNRASVKIGCTIRQVNRLINTYNDKGKEGFIHGNKGRKPAHALSSQEKQDIITLYANKYYDSNFSHFSELLEKYEGIVISNSSIRSILLDEFIVSPKASRETRKMVKKILKKKAESASSQKERTLFESQIINIENAHSRRPRCAYFGEMLQMDASLHHWFGPNKAQLHVAIDDYSGAIIAAYFDEQETLNGYYNILYQTLVNYGIPAMFFTDNRTVFEYNSKKKKDVGEDTFTQFSYACKQLGIEIRTSSVAQAKGRVERLFQSLQSRLPIELRLEGITDINEANIFLNSYIKEYNAKFALPVKDNKSVFIMQPDSDTITQTLAILTPRVVDSGHCIKFHNKFYKTMNENGLQVHFRRGTKGLVISTFDHKLLFSTDDKIYDLDEIPTHERTSKNFDADHKKDAPLKRYIPDSKHPWRSSTFLDHVPYDYFPDGIPA